MAVLGGHMDFLNIAKKVAGEIISEAVSQGARSQSGVKTSGKTVAQWDREWICIGPLKTANLTPV